MRKPFELTVGLISRVKLSQLLLNPSVKKLSLFFLKYLFLIRVLNLCNVKQLIVLIFNGLVVNLGVLLVKITKRCVQKGTLVLLSHLILTILNLIQILVTLIVIAKREIQVLFLCFWLAILQTLKVP